MPKKEDEFELVQTPRGPRRIYKRNPEDIIYNFTAEGLASDFGRAPASSTTGWCVDIRNWSNWSIF